MGNTPTPRRIICKKKKKNQELQKPFIDKNLYRLMGFTNLILNSSAPFNVKKHFSIRLVECELFDTTNVESVNLYICT